MPKRFVRGFFPKHLFRRLPDCGLASFNRVESRNRGESALICSWAAVAAMVRRIIDSHLLPRVARGFTTTNTMTLEGRNMRNIPLKSLTGIAGRLAAAVILATLMSAASARAAERKPASSADENAIRAAVESYVDAYNRGDAKAVAAQWSETGEWISPSGQRFQGRRAIEKELKNLFAENKGVRIEVSNVTIRILSADAATEEGTVRVIRPGEPPSESTYLAVDTKKNGQWKLDSVHETNVPDLPAASPALQDLAWLVGQWTDQSPDAEIDTSVSWTKNKAFLNYSFKASVPGMDDLEGTQVIGWDPAAGKIRSWMFDSDGGFGEGTWSKKGDSWIVKFHQVLPDGRKASAENIYTLVDDDTFLWKSIARKVDGEYLPNVEDVKMVRRTTSDAMKGTGKAGEKARKRVAKN
jgi:uncharacterized protein (TIGR02246 family)